MARLADIGIAILALACASHAWAQQAADPADIKRDTELLGGMESRLFVDAHSDLRYRNKGQEAYREGHHRDAFHYFRLASRYADKTSQSLVSLMYWTGDGVTKDRPLAYAWMELAASRGYPELLRQRQIYWDELSDAERAKARELRPTLEADYGDAVGARRLTLEIGSMRARVTGSHVGWLGTGTVTYGDNAVEDFSKFDKALHMSTAEYLDVKDLQWQLQMNSRVDVGEPERVEPPPANPTRPAS
ncbi:sel1 repeat family protein [Dyella japonica]|uniref:sel1 repeat family protein n=1 Tax=Dyella japonica TaxID=231455 RepID=UPI00069C120B|nr:sel1 repeat family protein [Dyella japonica]